MPDSSGAPATWLVVNGASGSNGEESADAISAALAAAGHAPARVIDMQTGDAPSPGDLEAADVGLLVVFTGDGSANAVITALQGWAGEVLLLPGGTANLLACDLHGDADADAIIAALGSSRLSPVQRHVIGCSQGTALIEVLAGPGATWSDVREGLREGDLGEVAGTALEAARQSTGGAMVRVAEPQVGREDGYAGVRLSPVGGTMTVDGYGAQTVADTIRQGIALLRRDFREGPHDELGRHGHVRCHSLDGSPIELMIDGERLTGAADETFALVPLRVNLLAMR